MKNPIDMTKRTELNTWSLEREKDFSRVIKFLESSRDKFTDNEYKLHRKLRETEYSRILEDIDEVIREIRIVYRRLEIFTKQYKSLSDNAENFTHLKKHSTETSDTMELFKDKWNMRMYQIDKALRIVK